MFKNVGDIDVEAILPFKNPLYHHLLLLRPPSLFGFGWSWLGVLLFLLLSDFGRGREGP